MRMFNADKVAHIMEWLKTPPDVPIESKTVSRSIRSAQTQVEQQNFEIRKDVLKYDDVMNRQRHVIYGERHQVLEGADMREQILAMMDDVIGGYVAAATSEGFPEEWDLDQLWRAFGKLYPAGITPDAIIEEAGGERAGLSGEFITETMRQDARDAYERREAQVTPEIMRDLERRVVLAVLDRKWREHLYEMDYLREGIGLRAWAQRDPLVEYQNEGYQMFDSMKEGIKEDSVGNLFHLQVEVQESPVLEDREADPAAVDTGGRGPGGRAAPAVLPGLVRVAGRRAAAPARRRAGGRMPARAHRGCPHPGRPLRGWPLRGWASRGGLASCSTPRPVRTFPGRLNSAPSRPAAATTPGSAGTRRARAGRARSTSSATATRVTGSAGPVAQAASMAGRWRHGPALLTPVQSHRPGCRSRSRSSRTASARVRAPKLTTTVISTTPAAGCAVTTRRTRGRCPAISVGPSCRMRWRAAIVVHGTICRAGRDPASVSARTCANWPGQPSAGSGPPAGRPARDAVPVTSRPSGPSGSRPSRTSGPPGTPRLSGRPGPSRTSGRPGTPRGLRGGAPRAGRSSSS